MAIHTDIQFVDSACNPSMGCCGCELWRHKDKNIRFCYAGKLTTRFGSEKSTHFPVNFETLTEYPGRMATAASWSDLRGTKRRDKPWLNDKERIIFISDMGDSLSPGIDFEFLYEEIIKVTASPQGLRHRWLWFTKVPKRMYAFWRWLKHKDIPWSPNLWAGVSLIGVDNANKRLKWLSKLEGVKKFISLEPQWAEISEIIKPYIKNIDWLVQGGMSASKHHPFQIEWIKPILDLCKNNKVPYFLKQLGSHPMCKGKLLKLEDAHGGDWHEWPKGGVFKTSPDILRQIP